MAKLTIKAARINMHMTQDELAEKLDVSRQSVSKWESGKAIPDSNKVLAIAELFGVSTDFLLRKEEEFLTAESADEVVEDVVNVPEVESEPIQIETPAVEAENTAE